jgi:threonine/homoserine/homoserine lactone efflux protein
MSFSSNQLLTDAKASAPVTSTSVIASFAAVVIITLLAAVLPEGGSDQSQPIAGVIKIVLGALLLLLAVRQWRARPIGGAEPALPKWMTAIDTMTAVRAILLGFALSALNPKNLLMGVAAGVAIGSADVSTGEAALAIVVFTVIAASTVAIPDLAHRDLVAERRTGQRL